jgi:hypothetical protein
MKVGPKGQLEIQADPEALAGELLIGCSKYRRRPVVFSPSRSQVAERPAGSTNF